MKTQWSETLFNLIIFILLYNTVLLPFGLKKSDNLIF